MNNTSECDKAPDPFRACSLIVLTVTLLLSVFVTYRILQSRDLFERLFADFDVSPPLSWLVLTPWYAWLVPMLAVLSVVKEALVKNRQVTLIGNGVHLAIVIVIWQLYVDGVFAPFLQLMRDLS
jgi:hypothetical protein